MKIFEKFTIFTGQLKFENLLKDMNVVITNQMDHFIKKWKVHLKSVKKFQFLVKGRKKDAPGTLYKSTTESMPFFNREQIFIVRKVLEKINSYDYWILKTEDGVIIDKKIFKTRIICTKKSIYLNESNFHLL